MKISLIITVLNEEKSILPLLRSVARQKLIPNETIVVDGGSIDKTWFLLNQALQSNEVGKKIGLRIFKKGGNRSAGRNFAIKKAKHVWIAITDAGCVLDKKWLSALSKVAIRNSDKGSAVVVAGYYFGLPSSALSAVIVPYVLVMPDRVDPQKFLPATRSMLVEQSVFEKIGYFNESLSHNEDYEFSRRLEKFLGKKSLLKNDFEQKPEVTVKLFFAPKALVGWVPPKSLNQFARMLFRFAFGDAQAGLFRKKVALLFGRYFFAFALLFFSWQFLSAIFALTLALLFILVYFFWAILKNRRYLSSQYGLAALLWLPALQLIADFSVILGTTIGLINRYTFIN